VAVFCFQVNLHQHKLHSQTTDTLLKKRQEEAGIPSFAPHDLRRTCITHLLEKGVDIATVARLVGHAKIETTMRYDRRTVSVAQQAAMLLSLDLLIRTPILVNNSSCKHLYDFPRLHKNFCLLLQHNIRVMLYP
jgi:hypothetical protein